MARIKGCLGKSDFCGIAKYLYKLFRELNGSLIIIGEPGSGKTISLIELAKNAIIAARENVFEPIPIILNLSSWNTASGKDFKAWLLFELKYKYKIPHKVGDKWITNNEILLLLDGLNETNKDQIGCCINEINSFIDDFGLMKFIVCCRSENYNVQKTKLNIENIVKLLPLCSEQIEHYFNSVSPKLDNLHNVVSRDKSLNELSKSPLMLNIMSFTYDNESDEFPVQLPVEICKIRIFNEYTKKMFERGTANLQFDKEKTINTLSWLAKQMSNHSTNIFNVDELHSDWLVSYKNKLLYKFASGVSIIYLYFIGFIPAFIFFPNLIDLWVISGFIAGVCCRAFSRELTHWILIIIFSSLFIMHNELTNISKVKMICGLFIGLMGLSYYFYTSRKLKLSLDRFFISFWPFLFGFLFGYYIFGNLLVFLSCQISKIAFIQYLKDFSIGLVVASILATTLFKSKEIDIIPLKNFGFKIVINSFIFRAYA